MPKIEFRDVLSLLALLLMVFAMILEASGHPVSEWLKTPLGTVLSVILGFYFVDSARKTQGTAVQPPSAPGAPQAPAAPTSPPQSQPEGQ